MVENRDSPGSRETRVNRILKNIVALARARWEQAQREGRAVVRDLITGAVLIVVAIVLLALSVPLAVVTIILLLAEVMPAWGATGIVVAAMLVVAGLLVLVARSKFRRRGFQVVRDLGRDFITMRESLRREASTTDV
ncbi:MAG: phage holin family protein [bacterium]